MRHASGQSTTSDEVKVMPPLPPDGGYGWVITAAAFFNHVIVDGFAFTFGVFYPRMLESFSDASEAAIALVGSLMAGTYFLGGTFIQLFTHSSVSSVREGGRYIHSLIHPL